MVRTYFYNDKEINLLELDSVMGRVGLSDVAVVIGIG